MVLASLDIGDDAVCTATFTVDDVATNPTTVTWSVRHETEAEATDYVSGTDPEATSPSTGVFRLIIPVTLAGRYIVRVVGTGAAKGASEGFFFARASEI